jgi:hypothetical protein
VRIENGLRLVRISVAVAVLVLWMVVAVSAAPLEKDDVYLSLSVLGSIPGSFTATHRTAAVKAAIGNSVGAGLKAGFYLKATGHMVGIEFESYGHGLNATFDSGHANLMLFNTMLNLLARYPGRYVQPYMGVGAGYSQALLTDTNVIGRSNRIESAQTLGHQFLGGIRTDTSARTYLFAEYRYFVAGLHWSGFALQIREHVVAGGIGLRF